MVSETSVLNFHKVHSGLGLELVIILKFSDRLESPGGTMNHTSAIAQFRDSEIDSSQQIMHGVF